eukprot:gene4721-12737_t
MTGTAMWPGWPEEAQSGNRGSGQPCLTLRALGLPEL